MTPRAGILLLVLSCALALPATATAAPPVNSVPPTIDDTAPVIGDTIHAIAGAWDDPGYTITYQWSRCAATCADVAGATDVAYVVGPDDVGSGLQVREIATNATNESTASDPSAPTAVVAGIAPQNTAAPSIAGTPRRGQTLTLQPGTWSGTPAPDVTHQWLRCDPDGTACVPIFAATGDTLVLGPPDDNHTIRVRETATNSAGTASTDSDPTGLVPGPVKNLALPAISGTPRAGQTLTGTAGQWGGTSPTLTHQWRRCDDAGAHCVAIPGATGLSLPLGSADEGHTIRLSETATNAAGTSIVQSAPTALVPIPVTNAVRPLIEGTPTVGATLVSAIGDWNGSIPIMLSRRWQRCDASGCTDIPNATFDTYVVQAADLSKSIRLLVRAANDGGAATATSNVLGPVTAGTAPPPPPPPPPVVASAPAASVLAAFNTARRADLRKTLAGKMKMLAECTGPCRLRVRLKASKATARKWRVPRILATGRRNLIAAGRATVRPRFSAKTQRRLRPVNTLVVTAIAEARDPAGKLVSSRRFKVTLIRVPQR